MNDHVRFPAVMLRKPVNGILSAVLTAIALSFLVNSPALFIGFFLSLIGAASKQWSHSQPKSSMLRLLLEWAITFSLTYAILSVVSWLMSVSGLHIQWGKIVVMTLVGIAVRYVHALFSAEKEERSYYINATFVILFALFFFYLGDQDRFVIHGYGSEDLIDFTLVFSEVILCWLLLDQLKKVSIGSNTTAHRQKLFRYGIAALAFLLIDVMVTFIHLEYILGIGVHQDYWSIELMMKLIIFLMVAYLVLSRQKPQEPNTESLRLSVMRGQLHSYVNTAEVSHCTVEHGITHVFINDDRYTYAGSLDQLERSFEQEVFRASRQLLITRQTALSFQSIENKKIRLVLNPDRPDSSEYQVSRLKAPEFRKWMKKWGAVREN